MTAARCSGADAVLRAEIVRAARGWVGTPYCHQASRRGAGSDCLGLLRGVWREVVGAEPEMPPPYTPDWSEANGRERLLEAAGRHLLRVPIAAADAGDVVVMRMHPDGPAKHVAILTGAFGPAARIVHAYSGHTVCETGLGPTWARRVVAAFRFPARRD